MRIIIDHHHLGRIPCLFRRFGNDHRDRVTDKSYRIARQCITRWHRDTIVVDPVDGGNRRERSKPGLGNVGMGQNLDDPLSLSRIAHVEFNDFRMRIG